VLLRGRRLSIRGRALLVGLVPLAFLLLVCATVAVLQVGAERAAFLAHRSDNAVAQANALSDALVTTQKDAQRYLSTHRVQDLRPIARDRVAALRIAARLRTLSADNAEQERRATFVAGKTAQMFDYVQRYVADVAAHRPRAAAALTSAFAKSHALEDYQTERSAFIDAEQQIQLRRWRLLESKFYLLDGVLALGGVLAVLLTLTLTWRFGLQLARRLQTLAATAKHLQDEKPLARPMDGHDEIADLDRLYRRMADDMRQRESSLRKYRLLAQHSRDIILFTRRSDGRILEANAAAAQAYGYTVEEVAQLNARDLRAPETRGRLDAELDRAEDAPFIFETAHQRKDGSVFPVEVAAQSVLIDGEPLMVSIIRDISERRLAQREIQSALKQAVDASRLKSQFLATMSHEIRTPLNAVIGMTELLLQSPLTEEQQRFASVAHDSGEALLHLINDILDFSKIEAQRVELEIVEFKIVPLVEGVAALFASPAAKKRVALMTYVSPSIPQALVGDPGRLRQVLMNLTGNAVKFTERGSIVVTADLHQIDGDSVKVAFSVKDTGIGIPPETRASLFEPFRQADGSTTRRYGGTGLGLSISKGLVELMGGNIVVESEADAGSTFSFMLPFTLAEHQPAQPRSLAEMRALVVDDDPISQEIFARYLASWNMRCDVVGDPARACDLMLSAVLSGEPYDVAILDLMMPGMDGFELAKRMYSTADMSGTRLIMVTAYDEPERGRSAIAAGFSAYLTKPVRQSQLYDCIIDAVPNVVEAEQRLSIHEAPAPSKLRILVAEDNAINREVALRQLSKVGYAAQAVADGRQAVEAALSGQFDVVLMDCQMPNMDGFEATRAIRKGEMRSGKRVRIIAMTANALAEDRQACMDAGMDDYLAKPVTMESLKRALSAGDSSKALDVRRLNELFEGDPQGIKDFLATALPALQRIVQRLNDVQTTSERLAAAHELKGAAANVGAVEIAAAAAHLETVLRRGRSPIDTLLNQVQEAYERAVHHAASLEYEA